MKSTRYNLNLSPDNVEEYKKLQSNDENGVGVK